MYIIIIECLRNSGFANIRIVFTKHENGLINVACSFCGIRDNDVGIEEMEMLVLEIGQ